MRGFAIVDGCTRKLLVAGHLELLWLAIEFQILANDLIRAVFAGRFDNYRVPAGLHRLAGIVFAVPLERVLTGRTSGARDRRSDVAALGHGADAVIAVPATQVGEPALFLVP